MFSFKNFFSGSAPETPPQVVHPTFEAERIAALTPALARWKAFIKELDGEIVPFMVKVRTENMSACESFANHCRRVYYSPTACLRRAFEAAMGDPEYQALVYDMLPSFRRKTILGQWSTQRVVAALTHDEYKLAVADSDWKELTADFLIERFQPWAVYVNVFDFEDPTGLNRKLDGLYAGFEYHHDEVRIFCQMVGKDLFEPIDYHEFRLPEGELLGQAVEDWAYDMPYQSLLKETFAKEGLVAFDRFDAMKADYARAVGNIVFPLLAALFREEPKAQVLDYDSVEKRFEMPVDGVSISRYEVNLDFRKVTHLMHEELLPVMIPG